MNTEWLIIDGYSLLHRNESPSRFRHASIEENRLSLIRDVESVLGMLPGERVTIVFDGVRKGGKSEFESTQVEIIFSPAHKTADTVIEQMVHTAHNPEAIMVVSSDRLERETVASAGAHTMSSGDFLVLCENYRARLSVRSKQTTQRHKGPTLGDFFPE